MKVAVVGHVEACAFARVDHVPAAGEIVEAEEGWEEAAGGGAVAAVQLARLAGECLLLTALADDASGARPSATSRTAGCGSRRPGGGLRSAAPSCTSTAAASGRSPSPAIGWRRGSTIRSRGRSSPTATRSISPPAIAARPWRPARRRGWSPRFARRRPVAESGVELDVLVASAGDRGERYSSGMIEPPPRAVVLTSGAEGGIVEEADGRVSRWSAPPLPGPLVDTYGAGDSFAGGLTFGLARACRSSKRSSSRPGAGRPA